MIGIIKIILLLVVILIIINIICKIIRKKKHNKELYIQATDKIRDENLNNVILNTNVTSNCVPRETLKPYDVDYSNSGSSKNEDNNVKDGKKQAMLQLIERTELSKRKFILNPYSVIRIGSDIEGNDITVHAVGVSPHQCEIFAVDNKIYIRNLGSPNRTILKRKKESAIVDDKGVRLLSKDKIVVGTVIYDVSVINK